MAYWPPWTAETATATCWLAVTDATTTNGCMRFVPGSHLEPELRPHAPGAHSAPALPTQRGAHFVSGVQPHQSRWAKIDQGRLPSPDKLCTSYWAHLGDHGMKAQHLD